MARPEGEEVITVTEPARPRDEDVVDVAVEHVDRPDGANVVDGVAHACGIDPDGYETCLGCGADWPCEQARHLAVQAVAAAREPEPADVVAQAVATGLPWQLVADQLGVERGDVQAFVDAGH